MPNGEAREPDNVEDAVEAVAGDPHEQGPAEPPVPPGAPPATMTPEELEEREQAIGEKRKEAGPPLGDGDDQPPSPPGLGIAGPDDEVDAIDPGEAIES